MLRVKGWRPCNRNSWCGPEAGTAKPSRNWCGRPSRGSRVSPTSSLRYIGISANNTDTVFADNTIRGGKAGVVVAGTTSPSFVGNTVEGAQNRGFSIGARSSPVLRDNTLCGSSTNLFTHPQAQPDVDDSNEICDD